MEEGAAAKRGFMLLLQVLVKALGVGLARCGCKHAPG